MLKQRIPVILAVLAGLAAVILTTTYLQKREKALFELESKKEIVIAIKDISKRTVLTKAHLLLEEVPQKFIQPDALTSLEDGVGMITITSLSAGTQIVSSSLAFVSAETGLAVKIPLGKRGFIIPVNNPGLKGLMLPGDYVDILCTFKVVDTKTQREQELTITALQYILLLAMDKDMGEVTEEKKKKKSGETTVRTTGMLNVSLAVDPYEAQVLALMKKKGVLNLILRPVEDDTIVKLPVLNIKSLLKRKRE